MTIKAKIKATSVITCMVLTLFTGCGSKDELVELEVWKDKLITQPPVSIENPLTGATENIKDGLNEEKDKITEVLGEGASNTHEVAQNLGIFVSQTLKEWAGNNNLPAINTQKPKEEITAEDENGESSELLQQVAQESEDSNRVKVTFERVVDGDTIVVNYENETARIRLIGINAAESVHPDSEKNTEEGKYASDFLKEYMADTENVWLEFDLDTNDDYGRILAYVWLNENGTGIDTDMLNGVILKLGWAEVMTINPNVKYADSFNELAK